MGSENLGTFCKRLLTKLIMILIKILAECKNECLLLNVMENTELRNQIRKELEGGNTKKKL